MTLLAGPAALAALYRVAGLGAVPMATVLGLQTAVARGARLGFAGDRLAAVHLPYDAGAAFHAQLHALGLRTEYEWLFERGAWIIAGSRHARRVA